MTWKIFLTFFWGIGHYLTAIPGGAAMGLPPWLSTLAAYLGYVAIAALMLVLGSGVRKWVVNRFNISLTPDPKKLFWRIWLRWGIAGLGLLAPVTCGPYIAAILAVALGSKPRTVFFGIAVGCLPTTIILWAIIQAPQLLALLGK